MASESTQLRKIKEIVPLKIAVFGCGSDFSKEIQKLKEEYEIVCIFDNNPALHGKEKHGFKVSKPQEISNYNFDLLKICSLSNTTRIREQILELGIPEKSIMSTPLWSQKNLEKWTRLKTARKKNRVFIIGNGPSLTEDDLCLLHEKKEDSFAFNKIYLIFEESNFRPTYYMVEDTLVAENNAEKIDSLIGFHKFYPEHLLRTLKLSEEVLLFGLNLPDSNNEVATLPTHEPTDFGWGSSVTCTAIQAAIFMGYSQIHLLGVDFNFEWSGENISNKNVLIGKGEKNHFHKDYRPIGEKWNVPKMNISGSQYVMLKEFAKNMGINIINSTRGGELEVFDRTPLEKVLNQT